MSIVSVINDITEAQGGTPDTSGSIIGAIDALNDTLAGSDQDSSHTIEGAIELLGENIGGNEEYSIAPDPDMPNGTVVAKAIDMSTWEPTGDPLDKAAGGTLLFAVPIPDTGYKLDGGSLHVLFGEDYDNIPLDEYGFFVMPSIDVLLSASFSVDDGR